MRITPFALVLALLSGAPMPAAAPDRATPPPASASTLAQLNREHLDTLKEILKLRETEFAVGRSSQEDIETSEIKLIEAEIRYANDTSLQHKLCIKLIKLLESQHLRIQNRHKSGTISSEAFLEYKCNYLERKIATMQTFNKTTFK